MTGGFLPCLICGIQAQDPRGGVLCTSCKADLLDVGVQRGWTNLAHAGAFRRGYMGAAEGTSRDACPYRVTKGGGVLNGTFAWPRAWRDGWDEFSRSVVRAADLPCTSTVTRTPPEGSDNTRNELDGL